MKYARLIYGDGNLDDPLPPSQMEALAAETLEYNEELRRAGRFVASQPLQPAPTATTIRMRDGKLSMTDGPFAETKEQLGGFFLIEARDLNEAEIVKGSGASSFGKAVTVEGLQDTESDARRSGFRNLSGGSRTLMRLYFDRADFCVS
jgi:hypothetical protein